MIIPKLMNKLSRMKLFDRTRMLYSSDVMRTNFSLRISVGKRLVCSFLLFMAWPRKTRDCNFRAEQPNNQVFSDSWGNLTSNRSRFHCWPKDNALFGKSRLWLKWRLQYEVGRKSICLILRPIGKHLIGNQRDQHLITHFRSHYLPFSRLGNRFGSVVSWSL